MKILHRKYKSKAKENKYSKENDSLENIIMKIVSPYFEMLKQEGIKNKIEEVLTGVSLDSLLIDKVRKHLASVRFVELGRGVGRISVQYRNGGIQMEPIGFVRLIIRRITVSDEQIIDLMNDIIDQIQEKYVNNSDYFVSKIDEILKKLDESEVYKPETSEEKTLYDVVLLILLNHYKIKNEIPSWIEKAVDNIEQPDFIEDLIKVIIEQVGSIASNMSDNLFLDFKVTFDSKILRGILNSQTNRGQVSKLLSMMDINIKSIIYNLAENYISPSFIKGFGDLIGGIASNFLSDIAQREQEYSENLQQNRSNKEALEHSQITMTMGKKPSERNFRWYTDVNESKPCFEYSEDENFNCFNSIKADVEIVPRMKTVLNLGLVSSYSVEKVKKYSVNLTGLKEDKSYYYRIGNSETNEFEEIYKFKTYSDSQIKFIVMADSQGMVKYDYSLFLRVFADACKRIKDSHFTVHMGDFVDDGNNEEYWSWLLNSRLWKENTIVPVVGNHEARRCGVAYRAGVQNSVLSHFNVCLARKQNLETGFYYSYEYGNAKFVVLNTNDMDEYGKISRRQYNWALQELENTDKQWKIMITHKSPYSNGPHHSDRDVENIGKQISQLAYMGNVDLVIGGHDHVYVRTPVMSMGKEVDCRKKVIEKDGIDYETFINPRGTLYIVPGTTGVKNYKQNTGVTFPIEKQKDLDCPVYSSVEINNGELYFSSYKFDVITRTSSLLDCFAIEKNLNSKVKKNALTVSELIEVISDEPSVVNSDKILSVRERYNSLDYSQRINVNNSKLISAEKMSKSYNDILSLEIVTVTNKSEFLEAVGNEKVGTIIVDCDEIKFENSFGLKNRCVISRNLCIRGRGRLIMINFIVVSGVTFILDDSICIDNTRRLFSPYASLSAIDAHDNSNIIINSNVSIKSAYGIGVRSRGINLFGQRCKVYLNSKSENWCSDGFLFSYGETNKIIVNDGKYRACRGRYTFNVCGCGTLEVNGGEINNIKAGSKATVYIRGGFIGSEKTNEKLITVDCSGKMCVTGGIIAEYKGTAINLHGEEAVLCLQPDHEGALKIGDKIIYMGRIDNLKNKRVKIKFSNEDLRKYYNMEGLYAVVSDGDKIEKLINLRTINKYIGDNSVVNLMCGYKKVVIRASHTVKNDNIKFSSGARVYLFSKARDVY